MTRTRTARCPSCPGRPGQSLLDPRRPCPQCRGTGRVVVSVRGALPPPAGLRRPA